MEKKHLALKKLLAAVEKELLHKPDRKTLDRLSLLAGFQDWDSFQDALSGESGETVYGGHAEHTRPETQDKKEMPTE
jgi:hypothetical protein